MGWRREVLCLLEALSVAPVDVDHVVVGDMIGSKSALYSLMHEWAI